MDRKIEYFISYAWCHVKKSILNGILNPTIPKVQHRNTKYYDLATE